MNRQSSIIAFGTFRYAIAIMRSIFHMHATSFRSLAQPLFSELTKNIKTASRQPRRSKLMLQVKLVTPIYYVTKFQGIFISKKMTLLPHQTGSLDLLDAGNNHLRYFTPSMIYNRHLIRNN